MHPVMSELGVYLAEHEGRIRREAVRREQLVREAAANGDGRGMVERFVHAVRQFVDPRGYAMAELPAQVAASAPVAIPSVTTVPVTRRDALDRTVIDCEPLQAA